MSNNKTKNKQNKFAKYDIIIIAKLLYQNLSLYFKFDHDISGQYVYKIAIIKYNTLFEMKFIVM